MTAPRWKLLAGAALVAVAAPAAAQDADTAARIAAMQAQIDAMQKQLEELKADQARAAATPAPAPVAQAAPPAAKPATPPVAVAWKGAPEFSGEGGWKFKLRGRLQYDVGYVENPNDAVATRNLGFNSRARRLRLGAEGAFPGGFSYKAEVDFANNNALGYGDVLLSYGPSGQPWSVTIGNQETFQSLEQMTSSRFVNFLERAQMNEAFGHGRRLGLSAGYASGPFRINAGVFNETLGATNFDNDDWLFGARATYSPEALGGQLHFGANFQRREFQSTAQAFQYRNRPFVQTTDIRFVDTGAVAAEGDTTYGVEAAGLFGPLHVAAEAQWAKVDAVTPADVLDGLDSVGTATRYADGPGYFSAYGEVGYWLTGETRGYRNGAWDRTKVLNPFDKGGWGAFGVNARYDYLDLRDRVAAGTPATAFAAPNFVNGGTQTGYLLSLIWQPIDYVRFTAQYTRAEIEGGPRAAVVVPGSSASAADRDFGVDIVALRAQFDF
jgi:phosphate-selective porin OprO/OprP